MRNFVQQLGERRQEPFGKGIPVLAYSATDLLFKIGRPQTRKKAYHKISLKFRHKFQKILPGEAPHIRALDPRLCRVGEDVGRFKHDQLWRGEGEG